MAVGDNLLNMSQNYFSSDMVQKFSEQIGQSIEKTKAGLKSVIPAFLSGVVDKGSTPEGAASILNMVDTHNYESAPQMDASKINEGTEVVDNIFGGNLNSVVAKLNIATGLDNISIKKMMSLAAPGLMGVIANKVKTEKLGSSGLMNFLSSQKSALAGIGVIQQQITAKKIPWVKIGFAAIVVLALLFWWFNSGR